MSKSTFTKHIETKVLTTCFYFIWSFFKKQIRGLELISLPYFLHVFWRKIFTFYIGWLSLLFEISGNMFIVTVCTPVSDVINFDCLITRCFLAEPKKSEQICKYLKKEKNIFIEVNKTNFLECKSSTLKYLKRYGESLLSVHSTELSFVCFMCLLHVYV